MQRFFIENIKGNTIILKGSEAHHLKNVLRKKTGDVIFLFDGKGNEYKAEIKSVVADMPDDGQAGLSAEVVAPIKIGANVVARSPHPLEIKLQIISKTQKDTEPKIKINLYQSIPKLKKFDYIVEKSTELGVSKIVPVISERTVVVARPWRANSKITRWQKIALTVSKQCGRTIIPEISQIQTFKDAIVSLRA